MTATGHALIGALIAAKFQNPYIVLPLAFASHFACDILPHWDPGTHHRQKTKKRLFYETSIDVLVGIGAAYVLYNALTPTGNYILLYLSVFFAQLPDWITAPYFILHMDHPLVAWSKWMYKIQHTLHRRVDSPFWGIATQVGAVIFVYILLFIIF